MTKARQLADFISDDGQLTDMANGHIALGAIAKDISDTAVDVFVYDTIKDSDGGAWRKRTQHTSWYNEALNTATRGARKEFPAVAVIVAEVDTVTIYDADDPDMPMWMVWPQAGVLSWASGTTTTSICITALNGKFVWGTDQRGSGIADFIKDDMEIFHGLTEYALVDRKISSRSTSSFATGDGYIILRTQVNDVAMTVLPNAPIDYATGLPVPTIAVATDSGISIIRDNGTVVDVTESSNSTNNFANVEFLDNGKLVFRADGNTQYKWAGRIDIPSADRTFSYLDEGPMPYIMYSGAASGYRLMLTPPHPSDSTGGTTALSAYKNNIIAGTIVGFGQGTTDPTQDNVVNTNLVNYTSSSYNTGWMNGDIKLATLSDTDTTNIVGTELVDFSAASDWTVSSSSDGSHSFSGGVLTITNDNSSDPPVFVYQAITTVVGETYVLTAIAASGSSLANFALIASSTTATSGSINNVGSGVWHEAGTVAANTFTAIGTTTYVLLRVNANAAGTNKIASCTLRIAEQDRSVNTNGLYATGTVTKTAVATGADLVGYGGFTTGNYLQQPYNSDLDFGTGDFSIGFWLKYAVDATQYVMDRSADGNQRIAIYITDPSGGTLNLYTNGEGSQASELTGIFGSDDWVQCWCIRRSGTLEIWVNGVNKASSALTSRDVTQLDSAPLVIARRFNGSTVGTDVNLALFRISATAPTAEQIAKMYNDEKYLFQENAKATLYGTSDAVTALAYDDSTELLHVGTSAGRSVFQGLRRVDNTTDAVGAAISASNGLVAED